MHCTGSFVELFVIIYIHVVKQPKKQDVPQVTGARCIRKNPKKLTRVHSVIFVISLKLNIFLFSASILTFSTQNHLILTYFTHFDTTHFFYKYYKRCNTTKEFSIAFYVKLKKIELSYRIHLKFNLSDTHISWKGYLIGSLTPKINIHLMAYKKKQTV